jgi:hypothetical protein
VGNDGLQLPHDDGEVALLAKNIYPKAGLLVECIAAIAGAFDKIGAHQAAIALKKGERQLLRMVGRKAVDRRIDEDRLEFAVIFDL